MHCEVSTRDVVNGYVTASDYTIYYTDDYVDKVETVETVTSESEEFLDTMEEYVNTTYEQYATDQPSLAQYIEDGKFLVDGIIEIYETAGATCEKN